MTKKQGINQKQLIHLYYKNKLEFLLQISSESDLWRLIPNNYKRRHGFKPCKKLDKVQWLQKNKVSIFNVIDKEIVETLSNMWSLPQPDFIDIKNLTG